MALAMAMAVAVAVASVCTLVATGAGGAPSAGGLLTARCQEPSAAGPIRWDARYEPVRLADGAAAIRILEAGRATARDAITTVAGAWDIAWSTGGTGPLATARATLSAGSGRTIDASAANLLSPDGNCSLYLSIRGPTNRVIGVIGDSVFASIGHQLQPESLLLSTLPAATWEIRATSGFGWGASAPIWPLQTVTGTWAIGLARGILAQNPSALVVELGANDAMRATFADGEENPGLAAAVRDGVSSDVDQLLQESAGAGVSCVVLVTAPEHLTTLFGAGARYALEAERVNQVIRSDAAAAGGTVKIADWATLSQTHHEGPDDWFLPDDIHPNRTGESALVGIVQTSIRSCPSLHTDSVRS